ncbi:tRNA lysidine(34) synthetase TilS [Sphingomonas sp. RB3P16]|uniref:tRNA lysidine(34) synthetase TilS n=1 Tax=Parasphingomonas frigoris TaxID=3096163 RepID=UPI002FCAF838
MSPPDRVPVDPALVERFRCDVARVHPLEPDERLALAVSGGPDSMALLALAAAAYPGRIVAATVDHRLRPAAADEARMVAEWCAAHGIAHTTLVVHEAFASGGVQAEARARRYALLAAWVAEAGAACLATAHHADDQAETFLMRAARGSGVAGLGGIRALQRLAGVAVIRPLLGWRVAELRALVTARAIPFVDDPSNADPHYERTRFRTLLRETPWLDPVQIAHAAAYAAEADATIREIEEWLWRTRRVDRQACAPAAPRPFALSLSTGTASHDASLPAESRASTGLARTGEGPREAAVAAVAILGLDVADLPRELRRRLTRRAIHAVRAAHAITTPAFTDSANIESLLDALESGKTATQGGIRVSARQNIWYFAQQPPRRSL